MQVTSEYVLAVDLERNSAPNDAYNGGRRHLLDDMPKIVHLSVKVHTCAAEKGLIPYTGVRAGGRYVQQEAGVDPDKAWYLMLQLGCGCRQWISLHDADWLVRRGEAFRIIRRKRKALIEDEHQLWKPGIRLASGINKVPRIDLISSADVERAYVDKFKRYIEKIEEHHKLTMESRAMMFHGIELEKGRYKSGEPAWTPDPFEGRTLFSFGPTERDIKRYNGTVKDREHSYQEIVNEMGGKA